MSLAAPLPETIRQKLTAMARQQRWLAAVRGIGEFILISSLATGACLLADQQGNLPPAGRAGCLLMIAITVLLAAWFRVARPIFRRRSWTELAAAVEREHPELSERLTTLVELQEEGTRGRPSLMRELLAKQTVQAVAQVDFTQALPMGKSLRRAALGLAAVAVLLLPFLLPGGRYGLSWNRLLNPWGNFDWGNRLSFHVVDGDRVVARGTDVTLQAQLHGQPKSDAAPLDVTLRWIDAAGLSQRRLMTWNAADQSYATTIPRVEHSFRYQLASSRAVSRDYRITAAERPRVTAWSIEVQPPGYTGLPAQSLDAVVGELRVPERSQIRFRWQFAEPVKTAVLDCPTWIPGETNPTRIALSINLSPDRRSATAPLSATASGPFELNLTSLLGLRNEPAPHRLAIIPDLPPEVAIAPGQAITAARPDDVLPIPLRAQDDYGLTEVELHWRSSAGQTGTKSLAAAEITGRKLDRNWELDLSEANLLAGQTVTIRLRAVDNRPIPAPQETWSDPWEIAISDRLDPLESRQVAQAQQALEEQVEALELAVTLQKQAVDTEHRELARAAVRSDKPPENQDELMQLQQRQTELRAQLDALRKELEQRPFLEKLADEHVPRMEQQLAGAQQSLEQAAEKHSAREQIEQLSRTLDDLAQAEDQLAKLKQETKALAALEQELAALGQLARQAERLADRAETLDQWENKTEAANSQATGEAGRGEEKEERDRDAALEQLTKEALEPSREELEMLRQQTEEISEQMAELLRRRPELLEAARQHELERLDRLAELARRLAESQETLADAISQEADSPPPSGSQPDASPNQSPDANSEAAARELAAQIAQAARQQQQLAREASQLQRAAESSPQTPDGQGSSPLEQLTQQAQAAAQSAQAGDLKQAAEQSQQASQSARQAAQIDAPAAQNSAAWADRQQALAEEFSRLAKSPAARQTAQEQGQRQLNRTSEALAKALEEASEQFEQQPLNLPEAGRNAEQATESVQAAGASMQAASEALDQGDRQTAAQQAQAARDQLQQAAERASQSAGKPATSSAQSQTVPGQPASQVAQAAAKLEQAQRSLAEGKPEPSEQSPASAESPASDQPSESSAQPSTSEPRDPPANSPAPLAQTAEQLRQAAQALSAASKAGSSGSQEKPGTPGTPGSSERSKSSIARQGGEQNPAPERTSEPAEDFTNFGAGSDRVSQELDRLTESPQAVAGSRNWGRLPKNLQTEILQGSTRKPHPEYAGQIKRYFERIARPAEKRTRP